MRSLACLCLLVVACSDDRRGHDDPDSTTDPGTPSQPSVIAECEGIAIDRDGVLDLDIERVEVAGRVTLNGAPLSDDDDFGGDRGALAFVQRGRDGVELGVARIPVLDRYTLTLTPGRYDVRYEPSGCAADGVMPCVPAVLQRNVALTEDGVLDVDVPVVTVTGRVTVDGIPMPPEDGERGALRFEHDDGAGVTGPFGSSGTASYAMRVVPDVYAVYFEANPALCADLQEVPTVPCTSGLVHERVRVDANGGLDIDLTPHTVTGQLLVDGAPMQDLLAERGSILFSRRDGDGAASFSFGTRGAARYALRVLPGRYDVTFVASATLCDQIEAPPVPCISTELQRNVLVDRDGGLDLEVATIEVRGQVTRDGATLPRSDTERGRLRFTDASADPEQASAALAPSLGTNGRGEYAITLVPGRYVVAFEAPYDTCREDNAVPCVSADLRTVALDADGVLDLDLPTVSVIGELTLDGATMPDADSDRGALVIARRTSDDEDEEKAAEGSTAGGSTESFAESGEASFGATLIRGTYDFSYVPSGYSCDGTTRSRIPCEVGRARTIEISTSGVLSLDLTPARLTGRVLVEGVPLSDDLDEELGELLFSITDRAGGFATIPLEPRYDVTLIAGRHAVLRNPDYYGACDGEAATRLPCTTSLLAGCNDLR